VLEKWYFFVFYGNSLANTSGELLLLKTSQMTSLVITQ